jgi:dihydrolipoamide dehydrogenase
VSETGLAERYDAVVIGAGPGGYVCAIRLAQLGRKTLVVERERAGGVCLNWGCIPVKALLHAASVVRHAAEMRAAGILFEPPQVDLLTLYSWKGRVVDRLVRGVEFLLRSNGVQAVKGSAALDGPGRVSIKLDDGTTATVRAGAVVIATGSKPTVLPGLEPDGQRIIDSNGALNLFEKPQRLAVVGAGVIGLEFATIFSRLGTKVTVLELMPQVLPGTETEIAGQVQRLMQREGIEFHLGVKVLGAEPNETIRLKYQDSDGEQAVEADKVLVAVGRVPLSDGLNLKSAGAGIDGRGYIKTNAKLQAAGRTTYAIGDVRGGPLLAHKAMAEGISAAETIAGVKAPKRFTAIPSVVYTDPEVATVGLTEAEAQAQGRAVKVSRVPLTAVGRSLTLGRSEGLAKLVVDAGTDKVLGMQMVGPQADVLIAEAAVAVELGLKAADIGRVVHPHPTMSELLFEAAEAIHGKAVHVVNR